MGAPIRERVETLVLARMATSRKRVPSATLVSALRRYAPSTLGEGRWGELVTEVEQGLRAQLLDSPKAAAAELEHRLGSFTAKQWRQWVGKVLPALGLQIPAGDSKTHKRLDSREKWAAAVVARSLGMWTEGVPPTETQLGNRLVWRQLGLAGSAKPCPPEIRAHFLREHIPGDRGTAESMLRQIAARATSALRPDLPAITLALVQNWLAGQELGASPPRSRIDEVRSAGREVGASSPRSLIDEVRPAGREVGASSPRSLIDDVRSAARSARDGVFGDRKVFISTVWNALREKPSWHGMELDDFKSRLVKAHRDRELVLARADLVAAMDPNLVASSETRTDGATFHFIVREPPQ
jgi:hypothetical protein